VIIRNDLFHNDCHKCNSWTLGRMKYMNYEKWKSTFSYSYHVLKYNYYDYGISKWGKNIHQNKNTLYICIIHIIYKC